MTATLGLAAVAAARRALDAGATGAVTAGVATAWAVQAAAYWSLAGRLARGHDALRTWVAGIAARMAGIAVLAVAAGPAGWPVATLLVAYGVAVVAGLMLEVLWLSKMGAEHPGRR